MGGSEQQAGEAEAPRIGASGARFVYDLLTTERPQTAIQKVQAVCSLQDPLAAPLLGVIDQLGILRCEAHKGILQAARNTLLQRLASVDDRIRLERLLNASFSYLGISELREVPLAVMNMLERVPAQFLKQLTTERQIFKDLPEKVKRQVWEFDKNLLQQDALPLVGQYKYELFCIMRALHMDEFLFIIISTSRMAGAGKPPRLMSDPEKDAPGQGAPGSKPGGRSGPAARGPAAGRGGRGAVRPPGTVGGGPAASALDRAPKPVTRKILRKGSKILQALKSMIGGSYKIYTHIVELCTVKYRDTEQLYAGFKDLSYCTLRSHLLMALHDDSNPLALRDRCHELAWTIDAAIAAGRITDKHLQKLEQFFRTVEEVEQRVLQQQTASGASGAATESAGDAIGIVEPYKVLGDAGTILRDPSAMHLVGSMVLALALEGALAEGRLPRDSPQLCFLLRLMQLAVDSKQMMRDHKYRMPEPDTRALHDLLPLLAALAASFEVSGSPQPKDLKREEVDTLGPSAGREVEARALDALKRSEVCRRLAQLFVLERMSRLDYLGATRVLRLLANTLRPSSIPEYFDFGHGLAQRLADWVKAKRVGPSSPMWHYALENILIKVVDSHTQVHEEVLRLLLLAEPLLDGRELGQYLRLTLDATKRSRKRAQKKAQQAQAQAAKELDAQRTLQAQSGGMIDAEQLASMGYTFASDIGSDIGSDGWAGVLEKKEHAYDAVRFVYNKFRNSQKLDDENAPALFAYLAEGDKVVAEAEAARQQEAAAAVEAAEAVRRDE